MRRRSLRLRLLVTFGLGALALSATMAGLTYFTARQFILHERETAILRQAYVNASLARSSLRSPNANQEQLLENLDTLPGSLSVLEQRGQWYADSVTVGENAIPARLRSLVLSQRFMQTRAIVLLHHTNCGLQQRTSIVIGQAPDHQFGQPGQLRRATWLA